MKKVVKKREDALQMQLHNSRLSINPSDGQVDVIVDQRVYSRGTDTEYEVVTFLVDGSPAGPSHSFRTGQTGSSGVLIVAAPYQELMMV